MRAISRHLICRCQAKAAFCELSNISFSRINTKHAIESPFYWKTQKAILWAGPVSVFFQGLLAKVISIPGVNHFIFADSIFCFQDCITLKQSE